MIKDRAIGILILVVTIVIVSPLLLLVLAGALISAMIVLLVSPLIAVVSLWFGEGNSFGQRFIFNVSVTFGFILDGLGSAF